MQIKLNKFFICQSIKKLFLQTIKKYCYMCFKYIVTVKIKNYDYI